MKNEQMHDHYFDRFSRKNYFLQNIYYLCKRLGAVIHIC